MWGEKTKVILGAYKGDKFIPSLSLGSKGEGLKSRLALLLNINKPSKLMYENTVIIK